VTRTSGIWGFVHCSSSRNRDESAVNFFPATPEWQQRGQQKRQVRRHSHCFQDRQELNQYTLFTHACLPLDRHTMADFYLDAPEVPILLLGDPGVGKSTFLS